MKVVFMEEVEGTALVGEVKNVADGFARNYLLPRRLAAPATDHYLTIAKARAEKVARRQERVDEETREHLVPKVEGRSVTIEVRVGEQGKLFGSVTARDIAEALKEATGIELEHKQVDLRNPIREIGQHDVTVKLTRNVHVQVAVNVEPLGGMPEPETEAAAEEGEEAIEVAPEQDAETEEETHAAAEPEAEVEADSEETPTEEAEAEAEPAEAAVGEEEGEPEAEAEAEEEEPTESEAEEEEPTESEEAEPAAEEETGEEAAEEPKNEAETEAEPTASDEGDEEEK